MPPKNALKLTVTPLACARVAPAGGRPEDLPTSCWSWPAGPAAQRQVVRPITTIKTGRL